MAGDVGEVPFLVKTAIADPEKMVTVIDVATGAVVGARESIESSIVEDNFNSVVTPASVGEEIRLPAR